MNEPACFKTIRVADWGSPGGAFCVDEEDGHGLYTRIRNAFQAGIGAELDFSGVTHLTSHFLDASIGRLFGEYPEELVRSRLRFTNTDDDHDLHLIRRVMETAVHYYKYPQRWTSPGRMVEDSERLAIGCRTLAGYVDGKKLIGIPASGDPDYMCGWRLGRKRADLMLSLMQKYSRERQSELYYRLLHQGLSASMRQDEPITFTRTEEVTDQEMVSSYSFISATICTVYGISPEELKRELGTVERFPHDEARPCS